MGTPLGYAKRSALILGLLCVWQAAPLLALETPTPTPTEAPSPTPGACTTYTTSTSTDTIVPGTTDIGNHCNNCTTAIIFPFPVTLYGTIFTTANISSNGNIQFTSNLDVYAIHCPLPNGGFGESIMAYQTDLNTSVGSAGIRTSVSGVAPNRIFNIEWLTYYTYLRPGTAHFEVRLFENTSTFEILYGATEGNGSFEQSGVQQSDTGPATQFSCQTPTLTSGLKVTYSCTEGTTPTPTPTQPPPTALYVSDWNFGGILKFDATGQMTIFASGINNPAGLAFDNAGNLYVANGQSGITIFDPSGNIIGFWGGGASLVDNPLGLAFDSNAVLYVANYHAGNILKIDSTGHQTIYVGMGCCASFNPVGLAFDQSGNLCVTANNGALRKFAPSGSWTHFGSGSSGLAFDSNGNLYAADYGAQTIAKFDPAGEGTPFAVTSGFPNGIAFDSAGTLYVAETGNNTIEKFDSAGQGTFFASGLGAPYGIAIQPSAIPTPSPTPTPSTTPTPTPSSTPTETATPTSTPAPVAITISLPIADFDASTPIATVIIQPVVTSNIDASRNYVGFQGDFTFDSAVVSFSPPYVQKAGLTAGNWGVSAYVLNTGPGTIKTLRIAAFTLDYPNGGELNGSGTLFELLMRRVSSTPGASTALTWAADPDDFLFVDFDLNRHVPTQNNGLIAITGISISGTISYCSNPSPGPVSNVALNLTGDTTVSAMTDSVGNYQFSSLATGGSYTVTPTKTALPPGSSGINTVDVIAVQRHFLNVEPLPPGCRMTAANVDGDTAINTLDVIAIQRFYVGRTFGLANVGKYQFTPESRTYPGIVTDQIGQNYDVLVFGDVAGPFAERRENPGLLSGIPAE